MTCECTIVFFWTFPLFCAVFLLIFKYRDLLRTRLYYELLAHHVFIDFENIDFFQSLYVRLLLVYMILGMCMYPFSENTSVAEISSTIPFWIPLWSFALMIYMAWDLETRLVSVSKYTESTFEGAQFHMSHSVAVPDFVWEDAFEEVQKENDMSKYETIADLIEDTVTMVQLSVESGRAATRDSEEEVFFFSFSGSWWVYKFLYQPSFRGERQERFMRWFFWYRMFTYAIIFFLCYLLFCTAISHLREQSLIERSEFTKWFRVENFLFHKHEELPTKNAAPEGRHEFLLMPLPVPGQ